MRMGAQAGGGEEADGALTASAIVNGWEIHEIADLLRRHADERDAKRLATAIAAARPIATTAQLAAAIDSAPARPGPRSKAVKRLSRVFQARHRSPVPWASHGHCLAAARRVRSQHHRAHRPPPGASHPIVAHLRCDCQALRIEVNAEVAQLETILGAASSLVRTGGRLAVLSYHSVEDGRVKRLLRAGRGMHCTPS